MEHLPGGKLKNIISSHHFVYWYNSHPDITSLDINLNVEKAAIIGF